MRPTLPNKSIFRFIVAVFVVIPFVGLGQTTVYLTTGSGATYTVPCGVTSITVTAIGGGGGGGGSNTGGESGGGGGAGGSATSTFIVVPGNTFTYTIGAGGAGGAAGLNGSVGSNTTFGVLTGSGGFGGIGDNSGGAGGAGGSASGGSSNVIGGAGLSGTASTTGGIGGSTTLYPGTGGLGGATGIDGSPGTNFGAGGGGGGEKNGSATPVGASGFTGGVIITFTSSEVYPNAGPDVNLCGVTNLAGNTAVDGYVGTWTKISGAGTITTPSSATSGVTGITSGTCSVFRWTFTKAGCVTVYDEVTICNPNPCNDDPCGATALTVNASCITVGSTLTGATVTTSVSETGCGYDTYYGSPKNDVWFSAVVPASGNLNINLSGQSGLNAAIYTGTCGNLTMQSCHGWVTAATTNNIQATNLVPFSTVFIRVWDYANSGGVFNICAFQSSNTSGVQPGTTTLSGCTSTTFYDPGGNTGNYTDNALVTYTICPGTPGQYVSVNFTSMALEANFDRLIVMNGSTSSSPIIATITGTSLGTYTSSNSTGCLTFVFTSDLSGSLAGWVATVSCVGIAGGPNTPTNCNEQNCLGGCLRTLCGIPATVPFTGDGAGIQELNDANNGCMDSGERCANWFYINPTNAGTLSLNMYVNNGQNQDFALWKAFGNTLQCPAFTGNEPLLCNIAPATSAGTGFNSSLYGSNPAYEPSLTVTPADIAADVYFIIQVQTWSNGAACPQPSVQITFGGTVGLSCNMPIVLPSDLITLNGIHSPDRYNSISWSTESESNSDNFVVESSKDGESWIQIGVVEAAGFSSSRKSYTFKDENYYSPLTYYRLKLIDKDGNFTFSYKIVVLCELTFEERFSLPYPNPTNNDFFINYGGKDFETELKFVLYAQNGKMVKTKIVKDFSSSQGIIIDTEGISNGIYQLMINQGDYREVKKITLMR